MPRERQPHSIAYFCSTPPSPTRTTGSPPKTDGLSTETVDESVHPTRNTATAQAGRAGCAASSMTGRSGRHGAGRAGGQLFRRPAWPMGWHGRCARRRHRAGRAAAGPGRSAGEGETGGRPHCRPGAPVGRHVGSDRRMHREGWAQAEPGISSIDCSPFFCASDSGSCPVVNEDENHTHAWHAGVAIIGGLQSIRADRAYKHSSQKRADRLNSKGL